MRWWGRMAAKKLLTVYSCCRQSARADRTAAPRAMSSEARLGAFAIVPSTVVGRVITIRILVCNSISDFRKVLSIIMGHYYRRFSKSVLRPLLSWLSPRNPQAVLAVMALVAFGLKRYTDVKARAKSSYRRKFWRNLMRSALTYDEYIVKDYYIVAYGLGIYLLNLLIGFLSPQADPETEGPTFPTKGNDEFKPFIRRLPEFKFWYALTKAVYIAFVMTFFSIFDVPVFWPILLLYWIVLFVQTMKRQKEDRCRSRR